MPCEKRERLAKMYLKAVVQIEEIEDQSESDGWQETFQRCWKAVEDAVTALYHHRLTHGC